MLSWVCIKHSRTAISHLMLISRYASPHAYHQPEKSTDHSLPHQSITPTSTGGILEQAWIGRQSNDIVRPDGAIAVKASGKDFKCHVCMIIQIDDLGKITRIDEYYNKQWDEGVREEEYLVLKGASLKEIL